MQKKEEKFMELYETIQKYVKMTPITKSILKLDSSLSEEDLIQDLYIKLYDKDNSFIYNKMKQCLLQIYNKKKVSKIEVCEIEDDILNMQDADNTNNIVITNEAMMYIKSYDNIMYNCIYAYYNENKTLREISSEIGISFRGVKNKIDKGLEILRDYYES